TNTATLATSSGVQIRPSGMLRSARCWASSTLILRMRAIPPMSWPHRSVATGPGLIAFTRMFWRPYCSASATVMARSAALAALREGSLANARERDRIHAVVSHDFDAPAAPLPLHVRDDRLDGPHVAHELELQRLLPVLF